jgi:hypothetical protein
MFSNAGINSPADHTVVGLDMSLLDRLFAVNVRGMASVDRDWMVKKLWLHNCMPSAIAKS